MGIFKLIATLFNLYAMFCFFRLMLSWVPALESTTVGRLLCAFCDPYLNFFRKVGLRFGPLDFSCVLALIALEIGNMVFSILATGQGVKVGLLLAQLIYLLWQFAQSLVCIIILVLLIRFVVCLYDKNSYNNVFWLSIDNFFSPILFGITKIFFKSVRFTTALLVGLVVCIGIVIGGNFCINLLCHLVASLPF